MPTMPTFHAVQDRRDEDHDSDPPRSPPPPSPLPGDRQSASYGGWRPAHDDVSLEAADWRARTALRRADRALLAIEKLGAQVEALNASIQAWSDTWGRHWRTASRIAWGVGIPLLVAALLAAGAAAFRWVSTLHH